MVKVNTHVRLTEEYNYSLWHTSSAGLCVKIISDFGCVLLVQIISAFGCALLVPFLPMTLTFVEIKYYRL